MCTENPFPYNKYQIEKYGRLRSFGTSRSKRREGMKKYGFGVDIGGTTCKLGLVSVEGDLLD